MGLLTELFVARDEVARAYGRKRGPGVDCVKLGGLTNLEFETLWAILSGAEWDARTHGLEPVTDTESTWTFKFPEAYIGMLRHLDAHAVPTAATSWSATEELACSPAQVQPVIEKLVKAAKSFEHPSLGLYLWFSL
jgi:hypothetical protein